MLKWKGEKMKLFEEIVPGVRLLKSPFGTEWSGIVLLRGEENILIDSGANKEIVDECLIPALEREGLTLDQISLMVSTHCHGDHIGGHHRIRELSSAKIAVYKDSADKIRNPLEYAKRIRSVFKSDSPAPPKVLRGVEPDRVVEDNELVAGRLRLIHTPGHDDDTVCWLDEKTGTLISGDSLQGCGADGAGLAFYQDVDTYLSSLKKLLEKDINNIVAGHFYAPYGPCAIGPEAVKSYLENCLAVTVRYDRFIGECLENGETDERIIACKLIESEQRKMPEYLFLALYTIRAHIHATEKTKR